MSDADNMRRKHDAGELPYGKVIVGRMEDCGEYRKYWHIEGNDGEWTLALVATLEDAKYLAALVNTHGAKLEDGKAVPSIVAAMRLLSPADREAIIGHFCHHCGSEDPRCQCWNDE